MGVEYIFVEKQNTGYKIIDNKMDEKMTRNVIDVASSAIFSNKPIDKQCEYIKNRLEEFYSNICWSVFIYTNGYCNVSYDDNLYICGQANGNFIIVFGHYNTQNNQDNQDDSKSSN